LALPLIGRVRSRACARPFDTGTLAQEAETIYKPWESSKATDGAENMDPAYENAKLWAKQTFIYVFATNPDLGLIEKQSRARPRMESVLDQMLAAVEEETENCPNMLSTALIVRVLDWVVANHRPTAPGL
jgi:hypothetical protein